jgi:hypothetical protein
MKSPDPIDPVRLSITDVNVGAGYGDEEKLIINLRLEYEPWWTPLSGADLLFEQINALTCIRDVLHRGGIPHD